MAPDGYQPFYGYSSGTSGVTIIIPYRPSGHTISGGWNAEPPEIISRARAKLKNEVARLIALAGIDTEDFRRAIEAYVAAAAHLERLVGWFRTELQRWLHARAPRFLVASRARRRVCSLASLCRVRGPPLVAVRN